MSAPLSALTAVSLTILGAVLASLVFRRLRIPDVPFLIVLGGIIGPGLGLVEPAAMKTLLPIIGAFALVIIVFDGALLIHPRDLRAGGGGGALLALGVFFGTTILVTALGVALLSLPFGAAVLLGMALGGAGIVIIIPLIRGLGVGDRAMTIVTMEAVVSDLLVIVGVTALAAALSTRGAEPIGVVRDLAWMAAGGALIGLAAGWAWARFLARHDPAEAEYVTTLAVLIALFAATEWVHASGVVAVLGFGIVLGNSAVRARLRERTDYARGGQKRPKDRLVLIFGGGSAHTHHDTLFLVRAFFFVGLGSIVDWSLLADPLIVLAGLALGLVVAMARFGATYSIIRGPQVNRWDREGIALMFPLGLVTAVSSVIPLAYGVPGSERLPELATLAILSTNLLAMVAVTVRMRGPRPDPREDAAPTTGISSEATGPPGRVELGQPPS